MAGHVLEAEPDRQATFPGDRDVLVSPRGRTRQPQHRVAVGEQPLRRRVDHLRSKRIQRPGGTGAGPDRQGDPLPDHRDVPGPEHRPRRLLQPGQVGCHQTLIAPGSTVILDGGTTALAVVAALPRDVAVTVVTHSPTIAVAAEAANGITADLFLLGVTGVHPQAGLTTGDPDEAAMKRTLSRRAADTWVLASAEKIGTASPSPCSR